MEQIMNEEFNNFKRRAILNTIVELAKEHEEDGDFGTNVKGLLIAERIVEEKDVWSKPKSKG